MKKCITIILLVFWCLMLFSGCGPKQAEVTEPSEPVTTESTGPEETAPEEIATLDIYYLADDTCSHYMVNSFNYFMDDVTVNATAFASIEEMDPRIAAEVNANKGPDVIVFPRSTTLDTTKMAMNGNFLDLSGLLANDETFDAKNYYSLLDAGNIGGKQLMMPLRFRLPFYETSQERLATAKIDLSENYTASQLMAAFQTHAASAGEDISTLMYNIESSMGAFIYDPMRLSGVEIVDLEKQALTVSDDVFLEYAEYARLMYSEVPKIRNFFKTYGPAFTDGWTHLTSVCGDQQFPLYLRVEEAYYRVAVNETIQILHMPNYEDPASLMADISVYAAVLENTDDAQTAYRFIRYAMDCILGDIQNDLPISRAQVSAHLDDLSWNRGKTFQLPTCSVSVPAMSAELRQLCEQTFDRITSGSIRSDVIDDIFTETMEPYIVGEAEFEECYTKFKNQMNLYLYE